MAFLGSVSSKSGGVGNVYGGEDRKRAIDRAKGKKTVAIAIGKDAKTGTSTSVNIGKTFGTNAVTQAKTLTRTGNVTLNTQQNAFNVQERINTPTRTENNDRVFNRADTGLSSSNSNSDNNNISSREDDKFFETENKKDFSFSERLSRRRETISLSSQRGTITPLQRAEAVGLGIGSSLIGTAQFIKNAFSPLTPEKLARQQRTLGFLKGFATGQEGLPQVGVALRNEPEFSTGFIAGEIITAKGLGAAGKVGGKAVRFTTARVDPKFVKVVDDTLVIQTSKGEKGIELAGGTASTAEPLTKQARLAGQNVDAVSAQRGLFGRRTKEIIVDKPLPAPDSPPLERAFFADPRGRLRQSRLGLVAEDGATKSNSFSDVIVNRLTEDISFKREKSQALIFPDTKVSTLPSNLAKKLEAGKPLSQSEVAQLTKFQLKPTGEFKPIGFVGTESEILLSPGEIITKGDRVGVTLIKGQRVDIFEAGVKQGEGLIDTTKLTREQVTLSSRFTPTTFVDPISTVTTTSSRVTKSSGSVDFDSITTYLGSPTSKSNKTLSSLGKPSSELSSGFVPPSSPTVPVLSPSISVPISPSPSPSRPTTTSRGRSRASGGSSSPIVSTSSIGSPSPISPSLFSPTVPRSTSSPFTPKPSKPFPSDPFKVRTDRKREQKNFSVFVREKGNFKIFGSGLSKASATRRGVKATSTSPSASFKILQGSKPLGFSELDLGKQFRPSKKDKDIIVEKRKFRINTAGELGGITFKGLETLKARRLF